MFFKKALFGLMSYNDPWLNHLGRTQLFDHRGSTPSSWKVTTKIARSSHLFRCAVAKGPRFWGVLPGRFPNWVGSFYHGNRKIETWTVNVVGFVQIYLVVSRTLFFDG